MGIDRWLLLGIEEVREERRAQLGQSQGESPLQDATLLLQDPVLVDSMLPPIEAAVGTGVGESIDPSLKGGEDQITQPKSGMTGAVAETAQKAKAKSDAIDNQAKMSRFSLFVLILPRTVLKDRNIFIDPIQNIF